MATVTVSYNNPEIKQGALVTLKDKSIAIINTNNGNRVCYMILYATDKNRIGLIDHDDTSEVSLCPKGPSITIIQ